MSSSSEDRALQAREFFSEDDPHYAEATFVPRSQAGQSVPESITVPGRLTVDVVETDNYVGRVTAYRLAAADAAELGKDHAMTIDGKRYIAAVIEPDGVYFSRVILEAV